ncbi:MAG: fumarylacetoacetate hydrolase family protein [Chlorobiota bacterium]|nr:MAG: fumarylacetoacetate hydrolase family protein [Chlorobiota bacterium]
MKFATYRAGKQSRFALVIGNNLLDIAAAHQQARREGKRLALGYLPPDPLDFLRLGQAAMDDARALEELASSLDFSSAFLPLDQAVLEAPIPRPSSLRDGYAFRQHVEAARRNRGLPMIPEFDEIPIFYFSNHHAITGPGDVHVLPKHCEQLDFELECAIVIGKEGRTIPAERADEYIAGYMVMNDWSARGLQMQEMKLNLGPAKGKDFATSLGPVLVTRDELAARRIETPVGERYDLTMTARINGQEVSRGNLRDMHWTFAQIIERASYGVTLYPGDVIGSGTCGTGCLLELNGSKVFDPPRWLEPGDVVECEIELLGTLRNRIVLSEH